MDGNGHIEEGVRRLREHRELGRAAPPDGAGDAWDGPPPPIPLPAPRAEYAAPPRQPLKTRQARTASRISKKQPSWRWQGWLPAGELCLLDGDPGLGKSTLLIDLVARITRGWQMPPGPRERDLGHEPAAAVMIVGEDSLEYTVVHRLEAAGADLDLVTFHEGYRDEGGERDFDLGLDIEDLGALIEETGAAYATIDPVMAFLGVGVDAHKDQDIRRLLRPLSRLAQRTRCAIHGVRHLNKLNGGLALYRGGGSIGLIGAARCAWIAGTDPDDPQQDRHILAMNKTNVGARPDSLAYRLEPCAGSIRIAWEDQPVTLRANDILGSTGPGRPSIESRDAEAWLRQLLASGPVAAADVRAEAEAAGHAWRTVERAKAIAKVRSWKVATKWMWGLPETAEAPLPD